MHQKLESVIVSYIVPFVNNFIFNCVRRGNNNNNASGNGNGCVRGMESLMIIQFSTNLQLWQKNCLKNVCLSFSLHTWLILSCRLLFEFLRIKWYFTANKRSKLNMVYGTRTNMCETWSVMKINIRFFCEWFKFLKTLITRKNDVRNDDKCRKNYSISDRWLNCLMTEQKIVSLTEHRSLSLCGVLWPVMQNIII